MTLFDIFKLLGGVAFFLFGMSVMSSGLEKMSGSRLEKTLQAATSSTPKSLALGMFITVAIQSSSAMTVMLVGLVNSGIMELPQTVGVIMGSNVGTTLTAWITSLTGIESENLLIQMLKPANFSPLFAVAGAVLLLFSKKRRRQDIGGIMLGFAVLMFGMVVMGESVAGLQRSERFRSVLTAFENPFLGLLVGTVFTGIIQSSAASTALLQTFAATVGLNFGVALPIIMGSNIGTCVTALLATIGVTKNARRVAFVHIAFNIVGTVIWFVIIYGLNLFIPLRFMKNNITPQGIAIFHSVFNLTVTFALLPFRGMLVRLAKLAVRDGSKGDRATVLLDEHLLETPAFAVSQCRDTVNRMVEIARDTALAALSLVGSYSQKTADAVREGESALDDFEDKVGTYLVKLSSKELSDRDSYSVSHMLHSIGDLERIGDHSLNLVESSVEMYDKQIGFTDAAKADFKVIAAALTEVITMTAYAFTHEDLALARHVEPLEQVIDELVRGARNRHIDRMQRGECKIEPGFVWTDLLINVERVSDHCSNIAISMIQFPSGSMEGHEYLKSERSSDNPEFVREFNAYGEKYKFD
ncbi:MAG: Na/Pi cotransporter family protein [Oscillospiraceae bacterium]|jgi:phosphate:Na+ symporter|nr:Na/Pi cotransporter family protein [Oscillospiraceae bacterium]